ncbi:MAG: hypothetical protein ABR505_02430 [Actinomycetota bacterium]
MLIVLVGIVPTGVLGYLAGWVEDRHRPTHWIVVVLTTAAIFGWATLVTAQSGDIAFCQECEVHGIFRVTGFAGLVVLLCAFWLTARRARRRLGPSEGTEIVPTEIADS